MLSASHRKFQRFTSDWCFRRFAPMALKRTDFDGNLLAGGRTAQHGQLLKRLSCEP
jgi:hypothetical protein